MRKFVFFYCIKMVQEKSKSVTKTTYLQFLDPKELSSEVEKTDIKRTTADGNQLSPITKHQGIICEEAV